MNYSFVCTVNSDSVLITLNNTTNIKNGDLLFPGLFAYSPCTKACTKVEAPINKNTVQLDTLPIVSGECVIIFSDLPPYKYLDLCEAMKDVQDIVENNGMFIQLALRDESNITRDKINGIKTKSRDNYLILKAHPVQFNPTEDQIEKAGFMEQQSVILWFSRKDFMDNGLDFGDLDEIRDTQIIMDETYKISDKNKVFQMGNDFLYYTVGLRKVI
jgi:hypothetical protein